MNPFVNLSKMPFDEVSFYLDEKLKNVNVIQFGFMYPSNLDFPVDFVTFVKSWCYLCILQECSDSHCKFTIVTHVSPSDLQRHVDSVLSRLSSMYEVSKYDLVQL